MGTQFLALNDAAWLYIEKSTMPMHVASLAVFALPEGASESYLQDLVAEWRRTTRFVAPFNLRLKGQVLGLAIPAWEALADDRIDLDYHLRHSALPRPGGERELGILVSRLHSNPLDRSRPLWEIHLIEGLEGGRFALYTKVHHAQVDGMGGMRLLERMMSAEPARRDMPPVWAVGLRDPAGDPAEPEPGLAAKLGDLVRGGLGQARDTATAALALAEMGWKAAQGGSDDATPYLAPPSILNGRIRGKRRFATQHYPLARIKAAAKAARVTINDVLLGLCAGALRRYLLELDALPDKPMTASVPVSVRAAGDDSVGNAISFIFANLHTDLAEPLARLAAIAQGTLHAKDDLQKLPKGAVDNYTSLLMAPYLAQLLLGIGLVRRPMNNLVISNLPGPAETLYFNGARMEQFYPVSLVLDGQALNITVVSYAGQFNLGFTGCRDSLPHMQKLAVYTGEVLAELETALGLGAVAAAQ